MLPLQDRVYLEVMAMKRYFTILEPHRFLVSYPGHLLWGSYSSVGMQSMYPTAPADLVLSLVIFKK